jgi:serine/threonine-protein kinase
MDKPHLHSPLAAARPAAPPIDDNARTLASPLSATPGPLSSTAAGPSDPTRMGSAAQLDVLTSTQPGRRVTVLPRITAKDSSLALLPSDQERYQLVRPLGSGAMGEVSLETDNDIGRTVAVKRLTGDPQNTDGLLRFIAEVRTIGQLEHPNIIPIHDVGLDEHGRYYFVMKYVDGETLESIITKLAEGNPDYHARYPVEVRLEIFLGLLHALQYAHDQGVLHRDIKPANDALLARPPRSVPPFAVGLRAPSAGSRGRAERRWRERRAA